MGLLKAYSNLDLRPSGVDSLGRLTTSDERVIIDSFKQTYGDTAVDIPMRKIDYALARGKGVKPFDVLITVKSKETPALSREDNPENVIGCLVGHVMDNQTIQALLQFSALKPTLNLKPRMDASLRNGRAIIITGFMNRSRYSNSSMMAFLLRKLESSTFGQLPVIVLWPSTKIDKRLNEQFVHYGFKPYGIGLLATVPHSVVTNGRCIAMWSLKPFDDRERR